MPPHLAHCWSEVMSTLEEMWPHFGHVIAGSFSHRVNAPARKHVGFRDYGDRPLSSSDPPGVRRLYSARSISLALLAFGPESSDSVCCPRTRLIGTAKFRFSVPRNFKSSTPIVDGLARERSRSRLRSKRDSMNRQLQIFCGGSTRSRQRVKQAERESLLFCTKITANWRHARRANHSC